ncbi:MAG: hypothetical protein H6757_02665 [Candidatus Omnitrophica bacterium]|nr:hypothetical protein [Candidatus Omnitrophota bacterium]
MKKFTLMVALLMFVAAAPGWCLVSTVDHAIEHTMQSDIRPVEDAGRILDVANKGVDMTYTTVTKPMSPILDPIRKVRDVTLDGTKRVINTIWDVVTLKHFRG